MRRELRDHTEPCEHDLPDIDGFTWQDDAGLWFCDVDGCPGGKLVVMEEKSGWVSTKAYHAFEVHNQMGEWCDDVTGTTVWVEVTP